MSLHAVAYVKGMLVAPGGEPLTAAEKLTALCLADYFNAEAGYAYPSVERLAAESLVGERQCRRIIRSLERKGVITVEVGGGRLASRYRFPQLDTPNPVPPLPAVVVEAAEEPVGPLGAKDLAAGLRDVLDGYLADFDDNPVQAYLEGLKTAAELAQDYPGLSTGLAKSLRNTVISHAAERVHGDRIEGREHPRLYRAATTLGPEGAAWVIWSLWQTATADIKGNVVSYVIKTAERGRADAQRAA
jgi:hypothetical protein